MNTTSTKSAVSTALAAIALALAAINPAGAQTITEKDTVMVTYPFSDPNPIPKMSHIYPYFRYDGFTATPEKQEWKVVILENDWLRVRIMPQIGGKVWSVYDKVHGQEVFYDNDVVKFRDIAMRGPWTSGGIEFNFGIIGHTPSTSFPVDYKTVEKEDGTVSCYIGSIDLLTRTRWTVEISLPHDKAWMSTRVIWHNGSGIYQPYYTWFNSGVKAADNMHLIYPGAYSIGHGGEISPWPVDQKNRDLSIYGNQTFGADKSMHVSGSHKGYFSVWWPDDNEGVMHLADRDQKPGRKYFTWALSDQGGIWKDLLTDGKPQYVELQSGRLMNQNTYESHKTPYKQFLFQPFGTDEWNEIWFPYANTGGVESATEHAVVNVEDIPGGKKFLIYPLQSLSGKVEITDASGKVLLSDEAQAQMSQLYTVEVKGNPARLHMGGVELWNADSQDLARPNKTPGEYDWNTAPAQYIWAKYCLGQKLYKEAEEHADKAISIDGQYVPALGMKSVLLLRKGLFDQALTAACKALAIDTYDPTANYAYGLACEALGKEYDAMDGFEMAAISQELRSASHTALARVHMRRGNLSKAIEYARRSLQGNASNLSAMEIWALASHRGSEEYEKMLASIASVDPLSHFPDFENFLDGKLSAGQLAASIQEEMRWQEYLETAIKYHNFGMDADAVKILEACPENNSLTALWTAWLKNDASLIAPAEAAGLDYAFPFRTESLEPLTWACSNGGSWKSRWLLSLLMNFLDRTPEAVELVADLRDIDYAPFYAWRATISASPEEDLKKAASLDAGQWRYCSLLTEHYLSEKDYESALSTVEAYYKADGSNPHISDAYIRSLRAMGNYKKADAVLKNIHVLPFEGQRNTRQLYRDIKLHLAAAALDAGKTSEALKRLAESREWPHNLGTGKPYDELIDYRLQDWMTAVAYARKGDKTAAADYLAKINGKREAWDEAYDKAISRKESITSLIESLEPALAANKK